MLQQLMEEVQTQANLPENMALLIERLLLTSITRTPPIDGDMNEWIRHRWDHPEIAEFRTLIIRYVLAKRIHEMNRKGIMVKGTERSCASLYEVSMARENYKELEHWMIETGYCTKEFITSLKRYLGWHLQGILWSCHAGTFIFAVRPPAAKVVSMCGILQ